jgi:hypothetical protein
MLTAQITLTLHLLLNDGFIGDNHQVEAIKAQIISEKQLDGANVIVRTYQDDEPQTAEKLTQALKATGQHVIISSGSHGYDFLSKISSEPTLVTPPEKQKPMFVWVGHQDPGLVTHAALFDIVGLPVHVIDDKPILTQTFSERLTPLEAVPNTLKLEDLLIALERWNKSYPELTIPSSETGYIGVFLGGDAPKPDKTHLYWSEEDAYHLGKAFAEMAKQENKVLLATTGPRTGKFYPDSPDAKAPITRYFKDSQWTALADLTEEEKTKKPDIKTDPLAHTAKAPIDPVSAAFLRGITDAGLDKTQCHFMDFKFGKSAYQAIIRALYSSPDKSIACYSGESISYAEIGYFIPQTFAFRVDSMNTGHQAALKRFKTFGLIGELNFDQPLAEQYLDMSPNSHKQMAINTGSTADAKRLAESIVKRIVENTARFAPKPEGQAITFRQPAPKEADSTRKGMATDFSLS